MRRPGPTLPAAAILALLFAAGPSHAQDAGARGSNGHVLWERCKDGEANPTGWRACRYFVGLAHETYVVLHRVLLDPAEKLCFRGEFDDQEQARILTAYLRSHPEERGGKAMELYFRAMHEKYPCPAGKSEGSAKPRK